MTSDRPDHPTGDIGRPVGDTGRPVGDTGRPVGDTGRPVGDTGRPVGDTGRPVGDTGRPVGDTGPAATDAELLATVAHGDRAARDASFRALVTRHRDRVHALCIRYFRDPVDAQDAVQETFLTVLRRAGTFRGEAKVSTWLYRVTINTCHDMARARARRPQTPVEDVGAVLDARHAHTDDLDSLDLTDLLRDALDTLDAETRGLLLLCAVEGVPYAEVAEAYGIAVGTVKSRVFRARAKLAALLAPVLDDDDAAIVDRRLDGDEARPRDGSPPSVRGPPTT